MSHEPSIDRKRKAMEEPDVAINSDDQTPKDREAPRVSLDSMTLSQIASLHRNGLLATERVAIANNTSASNAPEQEASMGRIGEKIQDLSASDNVEVNAALVALFMDLEKDATTRDNIVAAGACRALVQLLTNCLERGIARIPASDQVTEMSDFAELTTLHRALLVITRLTFYHEESIIRITSSGGVEAVVKVMKNFPKCQTLQERACTALRNLICKNDAGKKKAAESGGIEVLLAATNNHLDSAILCKNACLALLSMIWGNKERTELLLSLGGGAAISKIRTKWPEMTASQATLWSSCKSLEVATGFSKVQAFSSQPAAQKDTTGSPMLPASVSHASEQEASMGRIRKKIQDLSSDNNVKVNAALFMLSMDVKNDPTTRDNIVLAGGCPTLVQLLKNCLEKAIDRIPAFDHVTNLNEPAYAELTTLHRALDLITRFTFQHDESRRSIAAIGGVEAVVKVMKTVPKCQSLQERACAALRNLICKNDAGKNRALESSVIEVLLAATNNHLDSAILCKNACLALRTMIWDNKENTELLISSGGVAAVSKVRTKWPDFDEDKEVRALVAQMTATQPTTRISCKSSEVAIASTKVPVFPSQPTAPKVSTGSSKTPVFTSQPAARKDTTVSPMVLTVSSQLTPGIVHKSSHGVTPVLTVPDVPSKTRNDQLKSEATPELVSQQPENDSKCKSTEAQEAVVGHNDLKCKNNVTTLESNCEGEHNATKVVTRNNRRLRERKPQNARKDAPTSTLASPQMNAQEATEKESTAEAVSAFNTENEENTSNAEPEDQIQSIGALIKDLFYSDNITFDAGLHALRVELVEDSTKWEHFVAVGSCFAVVPIMWHVAKEMLRWISKESV
jgi:hypothetical protein